MPKYGNLENLMKVEKITRQDLAAELEVRYATIIDKLKGRSNFSYDEALAIKRRFFPSLGLEFIFEQIEENKQSA